jgi:hypothetical protein
MKRRGWQAHEEYVQKLLNLDSTICSGNKFYDPGDGVDRSHPSKNSFALIVDAKCTTAKSFSVKSEFLLEWEEKAAVLGKRFAMPIRFENLIGAEKQDYILLTLNDFAELLEMSRDRH